MNIVIVESPAKANTINKYLGADYKVLASYGHVRDLPSKDGSVLPDEDFRMAWEVDRDSSKRLAEISREVKSAGKLILATDPDREGEAISWHILEVLQQKGALKNVEVERVVFNAITKKAVLDAMAHPRALDTELVDAYLARRALDYLVGFTLSPVLWRKLPGSRSAGRVQSVALRLICDRETEIEAFQPREYWTIEAQLAAEGNGFAARLYALDGKKLDRFDLGGKAAADAALAKVKGGGYRVQALEKKPARRNPYPPFTTSTLQQEAARKLGFAASRTMQVAQKLYEGIDLGGDTVGLITYMRTDGVSITEEALQQTRQVIGSDFGQDYLPDSPRRYKSKAKNAQEAHEAIRPTDLARHPNQVRKVLNSDQFRLYELIWKRTIASQMEAARFERTTLDMIDGSGAVTLRATGQILLFDGFLTLYQESRDDKGDEDDENSALLPDVKEGDAIDLNDASATQHFTEPPPRFSEASLVKKLEELGIGRPSTYASTLSTLRDRNYVILENKRFIPEDKGRLVTAFLSSFFTRFVEYDFTAELEEKLDEISDGKLSWKEFLAAFWRDFTAHVDSISDLRVSQVLEALNEVLGPHIFPETQDGTDPRACPSCDNGKLSLKVGRYGAFIGCSNYPDCNYTRQLADAVKGEDKFAEPKVLGQHPETGEDITVRSGRFGPYIQQGEAKEKEKPPRAGIPKGMEPDEIDLDQALALLALPRDIGAHPESGEIMKAGIGRYGPYIQHGKQYASLDDPQEVFSVGVNRAVALLAEKAKKGNQRGGGTLRSLGEHPSEGGVVEIKSGRFGPYVTHNKVNASLPKGTEPDDLTMDEAVSLLEARKAKAGTKKAAKKTAKKSAKKAPKKTAKKATKKTAAKKKTAKKAAKKSAKSSASDGPDTGSPPVKAAE